MFSFITEVQSCSILAPVPSVVPSLFFWSQPWSCSSSHHPGWCPAQTSASVPSTHTPSLGSTNVPIILEESSSSPIPNSIHGPITTESGLSGTTNGHSKKGWDPALIPALIPSMMPSLEWGSSSGLGHGAITGVASGRQSQSQFYHCRDPALVLFVVVSPCRGRSSSNSSPSPSPICGLITNVSPPSGFSALVPALVHLWCRHWKGIHLSPLL